MKIVMVYEQIVVWHYSDDVLDWSEGSKQISDRDVILLHVNQKGAHSISATIYCFSQFDSQVLLGEAELAKSVFCPCHAPQSL